MTQSELESRIQVLLAGTIAEEMIFDDISTGAQNDLERATEIARSMVMEFGMSRLGRVNYPREQPLAVPGWRAAKSRRPQLHSEQTAREIDRKSAASSTNRSKRSATFSTPARLRCESHRPSG